MVEKILKQHNIESMVWFLLVMFMQVYKKKNKWAENVQLREKGSLRKFIVTAKEHARRQDITIK